MRMDDPYSYGVPQTEHPQRPPPPPPSQQYITHSSRAEEPSNEGYKILIIAGLIILLVGSIISACDGLINDPMSPDSDDYDDYDDYEEAQKQYRKDIEGYKDNIRYLRSTGSVIQFVGLIVFSSGIVLGALGTNKLSPNVRLGMLISMGLIVGFRIMGMIIMYWLSL